MTRDIRPRPDYRDLDAADAELLAFTQNDERRQQKRGLRDHFTPEQLELIWAHWEWESACEFAIGARLALRQIRRHHLAFTQGDREAALEAEVSRLRAEVARLRDERPTKPLPELTPEQPYKPVERRRPVKADELPTDAPHHVQAVARRIEEHVRRFPGGQCQKADVSAAFPTDRAYLADAYKHLHLSKRVRISGRTLIAL